MRQIISVLFIISAFIIGQKASAANKEVTLQQLLEKCERERSLSNYDSLAITSKQLLSLARNHNNIRSEAYGLFYQGLAQLFSGNGRQSTKTFEQARQLADKIGNDSRPWRESDNSLSMSLSSATADSINALVMNALGIYHAMTTNNNFVAQQYFFRSLRLAEQAKYEQLKGRIYGNLLILTQSDRDTTGLDNAIKIYNYGKKNNDYEQTYMGAYYLAMYYNLRNDNTKAERYLKESLQLHKQYQYDDISAAYTLYAKIKCDQKDYPTAITYAEEAVKLAQQYNQPGLLPDAYLQYATILNAKGNYQQSNEMVLKALETSESNDISNKKVRCYELMGMNCRMLGQSDKAMEYMEKAYQGMDTLSRINMDRLMHERSIMLDVEQKEQEAKVRQQQIADQRKQNIILIVALTIMAVLLSVIITSYRRRNRLYKSIVLQHTKAINKQKDMQRRIDKLTETSDTTPSQQHSKALFNDEERMQELYDQACHLMEKERVFTDPQLNRERFAEMLGTNRTYLSKILKDKGGTNYLQFVNSYRINEAVRILSDRENTDFPLKQIWSDLGFNSPATFYKLFQQTVGITPSVYRKQFIEIS